LVSLGLAKQNEKREVGIRNQWWAEFILRM